MSNKTIPQLLTELRTRHGFTQEYVAGRLHLTRQGYAKYEKGASVPDPEKLANLADLYNTPLTEFTSLPDYITRYGITPEHIQEAGPAYHSPGPCVLPYLTSEDIIAIENLHSIDPVLQLSIRDLLNLIAVLTNSDQPSDQ